MKAPFALLILATIAALAVIPDLPHRHLDDPSYWGVVGYAVLFVLLAFRVDQSWAPGRANRRLIVLFLVALPVVYVANWFRFGGSGFELGIQLAGLAIWLAAAATARRSDLVLWTGCAAHAVWDGLHFGRVDFVPDWYVAACLAIDVGLGAYVLMGLREWRAAMTPCTRGWGR